MCLTANLNSSSESKIIILIEVSYNQLKYGMKIIKIELFITVAYFFLQRVYLVIRLIESEAEQIPSREYSCMYHQCPICLVLGQSEAK